MDQAEEIREIIEQATVGNWIPATLVASLLALIISLILFIWKRSENENKVEHETMKKTIDKLADAHVEQKEILSELRTLTKLHDRDIERLKDQAS